MYKVAFKSILASLLLLVLSTVPALAVKGTPNVANTVHNLSSANAYFGGLGSPNEDEVCIFCHTPHGGSLTGPLWNRANSAQVYTHYTSATLSTAISDEHAGANIYDESRLCLSCHDGSISMYTVMNASNDTGVQPSLPLFSDGTMRTATMWEVGPKIGDGRNAAGQTIASTNDLSDDHPISFKYKPVLDDASNLGALHTIAEAETAGVRFFPLNGLEADKRVECSSCHDPHVDYTAATAYAPFLITPNAGSALCLACHNK
jgi:predicted CXXCH cytochrome family protein